MSYKVLPLLDKPTDMPIGTNRILNQIHTEATINYDSNVLIAPPIHTLRYYLEVYRHRKVIVNGVYMFQLEHTLELVPDIWLHIVTKELRMYNPNTIFNIRWEHHIDEHFALGMDKFLTVLHDYPGIQWQYNAHLSSMYYHRFRVLTKLDTFINILYPSLKNFPKDEKHGMTAELRRNILEAKACIHEGCTARSIRKQKYKEALSKLHIVNSYIMTCENLCYISMGHSKNTRRMLGEIINMLKKLIQVEMSGMKNGAIAIDTGEDVTVV